MGVLTQDIRYAFRSLSRAPGFTLVALVTLALGIGGTTAIFSIVDGVVLRPLPYCDPGRIVRITRTLADGADASFSAPDYRDVERGATYFAAMAGYRSDIIDLTGRSEPVRVTGLETTAGVFDIFDAPPLLGRTYHEATDPPGTAPQIRAGNPADGCVSMLCARPTRDARRSDDRAST